MKIHMKRCVLVSVLMLVVIVAAFFFFEVPIIHADQCFDGCQPWRYLIRNSPSDWVLQNSICQSNCMDAGNTGNEIGGGFRAACGMYEIIFSSASEGQWLLHLQSNQSLSHLLFHVGVYQSRGYVVNLENGTSFQMSDIC